MKWAKIQLQSERERERERENKSWVQTQIDCNRKTNLIRYNGTQNWLRRVSRIQHGAAGY